MTPHSCSKKSPSSFSMPNSFGTWPMMIVRARPMMKPLSTGSEMKLARNPRRSSPAPSGEHAGHEREHARERQHLVGPAGRQVGDGRRRERGGRRHRPDDEVARAAEGGVEDQRRRRGVEADDRRDAGDRRVGERLGDEHRPHGEPGDQVAAQPRPVVAGERPEDRAAFTTSTQSAKTFAQSFLMLITVQPASSARSSACLGAGGVVELALGVVVQEQQSAGPGARRTWRSAASATSPLEFPPAITGRRPMRLQIRTGFVGPSSKNSISLL